MPELCLAVENDFDPIPWRCNQPLDHDGAHASVQHGTTAYTWEDQA